MNALRIELVAAGSLLMLLGALGAFKKPCARTLALGAGALLLLMAVFFDVIWPK